MTDNPYVNQDDWGRDLLDRLGKLTDDSGAINIWAEIPTTGPDGELLGEQHSGYCGILRSDESKMVFWDGSKWDIILDVPFNIKGENVAEAKGSLTASRATILPVTPDSDSLFSFSQNEGEAFFSISRVNSLGETLWSTTRPITNEGYLSAYTDSRVGFRCVAKDNSSFYIGITVALSASSNTRICKLYAFNLVTGLFLWETDIASTTTSGGFLLSGICTDATDLLVGTYAAAGQIYRINRTSGAILSSIPLNTLRSHIFVDSNNNVVVAFLTAASKLAISIFDSLLEAAVLSNRVLEEDSATNIVLNFVSLIAQDPVSKNIFYFFDGDVNSVNRLFSYNSTTNAVSFIANATGFSLDGTLHSFFAIKNEGAPVFYLNSPAAIIRLIVEGSSLVVDDYSIPGGYGSIAPPSVNAVPNDGSAMTILKVLTSLTGFGEAKKTELLYSISSDNKRLVELEGSSIASIDKNPFLANAEMSFKEVYCERARVGTAEISRLRINSSNLRDPSLATFPNSGVSMGFLDLFSNVGSGNISSVGYTGDGLRSAGILFDINLAGDELNSGVITGINSGAAILFDLGVGKLFLQVAPSQTMGTTLSGFPSAAGMVVTNANNFGFGTEAPAHKVDVNGTLRATTVMNSGGEVTSDPQIKVGMVPLDGIELWELCEELIAISFLYKPDFVVEIEEVTQDEEGNQVVSKIVQPWPLPQGIQYGYNARKIQELFPELVTEDPQSGVLYLNREAIPVIFQSAATAKIKQLEESIAQKDTLLTQLQSAIESLTTRVEALENAAA